MVDGRRDTDVDGFSGGETEIQRYRGGWKETQHRVKGDTMVDGSSGGETEIQRYRGWRKGDIAVRKECCA